MISRLLAALAPLAVAACATVPATVSGYGPLPEDPHAAVPALQPASVVAPYQHRVPVEPGNWRNLNDRQAPGGGAS
ncbi:hypothetical protein [Stappia indica]|uniref:hypothetical protein n=1 Tax=Stappia indica TaxID=538381 RepID=UPI001112589D|nr:hypothetical protein [Stappia indica]